MKRNSSSNNNNNSSQKTILDKEKIDVSIVDKNWDKSKQFIKWIKECDVVSHENLSQLVPQLYFVAKRCKGYPDLMSEVTQYKMKRG